MGLTARLAAAAPPRAFPIIGWGGDVLWRQVSVTGRVAFTAAPHDADILLCLGELPQAWRGDVMKLYETLPLPRLAVHLGDHGGGACEGLPDILRLSQAAVAEDFAWARVAAARRDVSSTSNHQLLDDRPPAPWRGVGPHGQGGEGMMGGKPYGRPMAKTAEDPDQLALDDVPTALGPFFPGLPSGLRLVVQMQGDRVREVTKVENRFPPSGHESLPLEPPLTPAAAALAGGSVAIAALEEARARAHLCWAADLLTLCGLSALARRFLQAAGGELDAHQADALFARTERAGIKLLLRGVAPLDRATAERLHLLGPTARASGVARDARGGDRAYAAAGFACLTEEDGDCWARWRQRRHECRQALDLAASHGAREAAAAEAPNGELRRRGEGKLAGASAANLAALEEVLPGLEWFEAVLFIASLGLDMQEAALR